MTNPSPHHRKLTMALLAGCTALASLALSPIAVAQDKESATVTAKDPFKFFPKDSQAPEGAPNILLIMTDDVGFAATTAFGGAIPTPNFDALAKAGLRYNAFHTTSMCSPTRAALLTGRNHHAVSTGAITNLAVDQEGYTSVIPKSAGTIAQVLKENGYDTAWVGKNHNTPDWETGPMGPFDRWPNGFGFDYFYGFNTALTDQFAPQLTENRNAIDPPVNAPDYHLDRDLSDHLINWLQVQHNQRPGHPFFAYVSPGTLHSPHQAPAEWIERFKGKFDIGWDRLRKVTFARQKQMRIIPQDAVLTARPNGLPAWNSLTPAQKRVQARMMEVAAAQLSHSDYQIGRILDALRHSGQFENTLVIYLQGDNGASIESLHGADNELASLIGIEPSDAELAEASDGHGGPQSYGNYSAAWAWATNAPFPWGKQVASHLGGLRDGLVISWPDRIKHTGEVRNQFHHVIDIAPTIYEAVGISPPKTIAGVSQQPIDGVSMVYSFDDGKVSSMHREQYFEMLGNRSYYKDGWLASTTPVRAPWDRANPSVDPNRLKWELYDLNTDFSQARNVAAKYPQKLAEMKADFDTAAKTYHVYPLAADIMARLVPGIRPSLVAERTSFSFAPGDNRYPASNFPKFSVGSSLRANVTISTSNASGALLVQGGQFGGMAMLLSEGRPVFLFNPTGRAAERVLITGDSPLSPGDHVIEVSATTLAAIGPRAARLELKTDGKIIGSADVPILYRQLGDAYVGRPGIGDLIPDMRPTMLTGATLRMLDIQTR